MHQIHPNARTTPAVRAEIARSTEPAGLLAQRYGVSTETIRKWRKRGVDLPQFSGEALDQLAATFSNWAGLMKSSAEWRRTGL
jgi:transposase-like protein